MNLKEKVFVKHLLLIKANFRIHKINKLYLIQKYK
jgi:hypothetical protein